MERRGRLASRPRPCQNDSFSARLFPQQLSVWGWFMGFAPGGLALRGRGLPPGTPYTHHPPAQQRARGAPGACEHLKRRTTAVCKDFTELPHGAIDARQASGRHGRQTRSKSLYGSCGQKPGPPMDQSGLMQSLVAQALASRQSRSSSARRPQPLRHPSDNEGTVGRATQRAGFFFHAPFLHPAGVKHKGPHELRLAASVGSDNLTALGFGAVQGLAPREALQEGYNEAAPRRAPQLRVGAPALVVCCLPQGDAGSVGPIAPHRAHKRRVDSYLYATETGKPVRDNLEPAKENVRRYPPASLATNPGDSALERARGGRAHQRWGKQSGGHRVGQGHPRSGMPEAPAAAAGAGDGAGHIETCRPEAGTRRELA